MIVIFADLTSCSSDLRRVIFFFFFNCLLLLNIGRLGLVFVFFTVVSVFFQLIFVVRTLYCFTYCLYRICTPRLLLVIFFADLFNFTFNSFFIFKLITISNSSSSSVYTT